MTPVEQLPLGLTGPDIGDLRDRWKPLMTAAPYEPVDLAADYGLQPSNQGERNSCTGHAVAKMQALTWARQWDASGRSSPRIVAFSEHWAYYHARADKHRDAGAGLRPAALGAVRQGGVHASDWPLSTGPLDPPENLLSGEPEAYYLPEVQRVEVDPFEVAAVLSREKLPVLSGIALQREATDRMMRTGWAPAYDPDDPVIGYHAEIIVGWRVIDGDRWFRFCGSWGYGAGEGGFYWRPESYFGDGAVQTLWAPGLGMF